ncbi:MAG: tetratricopeptide repeat protein [Rhodospirillaceae bacterium]|nr:MAG: tetratricopeptide repeat protein [Rhodospirillaceae bacterium]
MSRAKDAASAPPAEIIPPTPGTGGKTSKTKAALAKLGLALPDAAERDPELEGLMSEIEADLREEELRKIWQRYGIFIIAGFALIVLGVFGVQQWRAHLVSQRLELARRYDQATKDLQDGKTDDALGILADLAGNTGEGYGAIAQLQRAAILLQKNDVDGAVAVYKALAANPKADATLRDLATLLQVLHSLDRAPPQTLEVMLSPLLNPGNPFNASALELSALLAAKEGDTARAAKLVDQILMEPSTPPSLRSRAQDLAAYYKSQTPAASASPSNPAPSKP